jgi:hypothetical protein
MKNGNKVSVEKNLNRPGSYLLTLMNAPLICLIKAKNSLRAIVFHKDVRTLRRVIT